MAVQGTDRWADIVSENSSTESVYVNFDVVSTSDEVLQSDLELEDTSSDVNDINAVAVQSEILAPQGSQGSLANSSVTMSDIPLTTGSTLQLNISNDIELRRKPPRQHEFH